MKLLLLFLLLIWETMKIIVLTILWTIAAWCILLSASFLWDAIQKAIERRKKK